MFQRSLVSGIILATTPNERFFYSRNDKRQPLPKTRPDMNSTRMDFAMTRDCPRARRTLYRGTEQQHIPTNSDYHVDVAMEKATP